jgi:hypothetical protein
MERLRIDSRPDFFPPEFRPERFAALRVTTGSDVNRGGFPMTFMGPFASRLSVIVAYVAIAFVGAIVLGVF